MELCSICYAGPHSPVHFVGHTYMHHILHKKQPGCCQYCDGHTLLFGLYPLIRREGNRRSFTSDHLTWLSNCISRDVLILRYSTIHASHMVGDSPNLHDSHVVSVYTSSYQIHVLGMIFETGSPKIMLQTCIHVARKGMEPWQKAHIVAL